MIGANFDSKERKVTDWKTEALVTANSVSVETHQS